MFPETKSSRIRWLQWYVFLTTTIFSLLSRASLVALWAEFGQGTGPVWLDELKCTSTHQGLHGCTHRGWGKHNCTHRNDVGLECVYDADPHSQANRTVLTKANDTGDDLTLGMNSFSTGRPMGIYGRFRFPLYSNIRSLVIISMAYWQKNAVNRA